MPQYFGSGRMPVTYVQVWLFGYEEPSLEQRARKYTLTLLHSGRWGLTLGWVNEGANCYKLGEKNSQCSHQMIEGGAIGCDSMGQVSDLLPEKQGR